MSPSRRIAIALLSTVLACGAERRDPPKPFIALLANGTVVLIAGDSTAAKVICGTGRTVDIIGRAMVIDTARGIVYALAAGATAHLTAIDVRTNACRIVELSRPGLTFRTIGMPHTVSGPVVIASGESGIASFRVDPSTLALAEPRYVRRWHLGPIEVFDPRRYPVPTAATFTPSDRYLVVSGTGHSVGADWVHDPFGEFGLCPRRDEGSPCISGVGNAVGVRGDSVVIGSWDGPLDVVAVATGTRREVHTRLPQTFRQSFVVGAADSIYAVGECDRGGYSTGSVSSTSDSLRVVVAARARLPQGRRAPGPLALCGRLIAVNESMDLGLVSGTAVLLTTQIPMITLFKISTGEIVYRWMPAWGIVDAVGVPMAGGSSRRVIP